MSTEIENKSLEVFGTTEVAVKEFMGSTDKSLVLLSDYELAKKNLEELKVKHQPRVDELVALEMLSPAELKDLNSIRAELREPRYLVQNIEKNNISVFEAYKKTDKAKLKDLIDINKDLEDKASDKIKLEDDRKKLEKEAEAKAEELRVERIKKEIDDVETYCYQVIQKMDFENMKVSTESVAQILGAEYDFEEFDLLFDQVKDRVGKMLMDKTKDITEREKQRQDNERMKKDIFEVRVNRLKEVGFELNDSGFFRSIELSSTYSKEDVLNCDSNTFENTLSVIKKEIENHEQAKRDAELKNQKDEQFNVRKNRLFEIGFGITDNLHFMFCKDFPETSIPTEKIFQADIFEFEEIMLKAKQDVVDAEKQKEKKLREERFATRRDNLIILGFEISRLGFTLNGSEFKIDLEDVHFADESKYEFILSDANKAVSSVLKAKAIKADAENKARVKRLAKDKESIAKAIELYFLDFNLESQNEETINFISFANLQIGQLKADLLTQLKDL